MLMPLPQAKPRLCAALDLGSHTFGLEVASCTPQALTTVAVVRNAVRLGEGHLTQHGAGFISDMALIRAERCLVDFSRTLRQWPEPIAMRAVGTQALRAANNRVEALERLERALGHRIDVISGSEEAALTYAGVRAMEPSFGAKNVASPMRWVVDIGGASTEVVQGEGDQIKQAASIGLGSLTLVEQVLKPACARGVSLHAAMHQSRQMATELFQGVATSFHSKPSIQALGSSGTFAAVARACRARYGSPVITRDALAQWAQTVVQSRSWAAWMQRDLLGVQRDRQDILVGGVLLMQALMDAFNFQAFHAAQGTLRHGLLLEIIRADSRMAHRLPA